MLLLEDLSSSDTAANTNTSVEAHAGEEMICMTQQSLRSIDKDRQKKKRPQYVIASGRKFINSVRYAYSSIMRGIVKLQLFHNVHQICNWRLVYFVH